MINDWDVIGKLIRTTSVERLEWRESMGSDNALSIPSKFKYKEAFS